MALACRVSHGHSKRPGKTRADARAMETVLAVSWKRPGEGCSKTKRLSKVPRSVALPLANVGVVTPVTPEAASMRTRPTLPLPPSPP